jgi:hypothetical protein
MKWNEGEVIMKYEYNGPGKYCYCLAYSIFNFLLIVTK